MPELDDVLLHDAWYCLLLGQDGVNVKVRRTFPIVLGLRHGVLYVLLYVQWVTRVRVHGGVRGAAAFPDGQRARSSVPAYGAFKKGSRGLRRCTRGRVAKRKRLHVKRTYVRAFKKGASRQAQLRFNLGQGRASETVPLIAKHAGG